MSDKSKGKALVMSGGKTRWTPVEKVGGGIDLEGLDEGMMYVVPEDMTLLVTSALADGTAEDPQEGVMAYRANYSASGAPEPGDGYCLEIRGVTFDNVTMNRISRFDVVPKAAKMNDSSSEYVCWLGNPTLLGDEYNALGLPDNGLPFLVIIMAGGDSTLCSVVLREPYFAGGTGARDAEPELALWKKTAAHVMTVPITRELWQFELEDGSMVTRQVVLSPYGGEK